MSVTENPKIMRYIPFSTTLLCVNLTSLNALCIKNWFRCVKSKNTAAYTVSHNEPLTSHVCCGLAWRVCYSCRCIFNSIRLQLDQFLHTYLSIHHIYLKNNRAKFHYDAIVKWQNFRIIFNSDPQEQEQQQADGISSWSKNKQTIVKNVEDLQYSTLDTFLNLALTVTYKWTMC